MKPWTDPLARGPFLWIFKKDDAAGADPIKRAPKNFFHRNELYTRLSKGSELDLSLENYFSKVEKAFNWIRREVLLRGAAVTAESKLAAAFCKPNPTPRPTAPVRTVSDVKSIPTALGAMTAAIPTRAIFASLATKTCIDGVSTGDSDTRRSTNPAASEASQIAPPSHKQAFSDVRGEILSEPASIATLSSKFIVGVRRPRMLNAAITQTKIASVRDRAGSRTKDALRRIATQAVASVAAKFSKRTALKIGARSLNISKAATAILPAA